MRELRREGRYREADELLGQASQSDPFDADIELTHCRYSWVSSFSWPMRLAIISLLCRPWRSFSIGILTEDVVDPSGRHRRRLVSPGRCTTHGLLIDVVETAKRMPGQSFGC